MQPEHQTLVRILNQLISACKDRESDFREAAELVGDTRLQLLLREAEQQFGEFAAELQAEERAYSPDPSTGGTFSGALRRRWMTLRHAVARTQADYAVLNECFRGEDVTRRLYREALETSFPSRLTEILTRQSIELDRVFRRLHAKVTVDSAS